MLRIHIVLVGSEDDAVAELACLFRVASLHHTEKVIVADSFAHGTESDTWVHLVFGGVDDVAITTWPLRAGGHIMKGILRELPVIIAPVQITYLIVFEVDPVKDASLEEGKLYEAVGIVPLRSCTRIMYQ